MGGKTGKRPSAKDLKALEQEGKEALRAGIGGADTAAAERHAVYLSYAVEDRVAVAQALTAARSSTPEIDFVDKAVEEPFSSDDIDLFKRGARERIRQTLLTVCYLTEHSSESDWVNWEVEESFAQRKLIIGMYESKEAPRVLAQALREHATKVVRWSPSALREAITLANKRP
ncbi:MAG TPA: TIR domain-containing protein [Chloroflexia bacterium]